MNDEELVKYVVELVVSDATETKALGLTEKQKRTWIKLSKDIPVRLMGEITARVAAKSGCLVKWLTVREIEVEFEK